MISLPLSDLQRKPRNSQADQDVEGRIPLKRGEKKEGQSSKLIFMATALAKSLADAANCGDFLKRGQDDRTVAQAADDHRLRAAIIRDSVTVNSCT